MASHKRGHKMLETYFSAPKMLEHLRSGPSGPYMDGFAVLRAWLAVRGTVAAPEVFVNAPGRTAEPLGICISAQATCCGRRPEVSWIAEEARLAPCVEAHMRDDRPAGDARHPKGVLVARTRQFDNHRNLHARRSYGEAGCNRVHVPPHLRRGAFRAPDKLITLLKGTS